MYFLGKYVELNRISALLNVILPVGRGVGQLILMQFLVGCVTFPANRYLDIIYTFSDLHQLKLNKLKIRYDCIKICKFDIKI